MTRDHARWLSVVLAIGFLGSIAVRLAAIDNRQIWLDESHSALLAGMPLAELMDFVRGDVHPPLYFLLLNGWRRIAGDSPAGLRAFSLLAGAVAGAVFLLVALRVFGRGWKALLACVLFWFSPVLVYYGLEVRMYALATAWIAVLVLGVAELLEEREGSLRRGSVLVALGGTLAFYTHYVTVFVFAGLGAFAVLEAVRGRLAIRRILPAGAALLILTVPWLPVLMQQRAAKTELRQVEVAARTDPASLSYGPDTNPPRSLNATVRAAVENAASVAGVYPAGRPLSLVVLSLPFVIVAGAALAGWRRLPWTRLFALVSVVTLAGGVVAGITARRFLVVLVPFLALALAETLGSLRGRLAARAGALTAAALVAVYGLGAVRTARMVSVQPTLEIVRHLGRELRPGDVVVVEALYYEVLLGYHARNAGVELPIRGFPVRIRDWWASQRFKGWGGPPINTQELEGFVGALPALAPSGRVWLTQFETRYYDPRRQLLGALGDAGARVTRVLDVPEDGGEELYLVELQTGQAIR
jgi:4-amino-4-deoxy-L-arabinose transferase-like glycosyltransferase